MFVWLVRAALLLAFLTVVYLALSFFKRWEERKRLGAAYEQTTEAAARSDVDREAFVHEGLSRYEGSLRKKLLWGVYVFPFAVLALLIAVAEWG